MVTNYIKQKTTTTKKMETIRKKSTITLKHFNTVLSNLYQKKIRNIKDLNNRISTVYKMNLFRTASHYQRKKFS